MTQPQGSAADEAGQARQAVYFRWQHGASLDTLVLFLREHGFNVGAAEAIDAGRLVAYWAGREQQLRPPAAVRPAQQEGRAAGSAAEWMDAAWLAPKLRPIFCKDRDSQARFDELFAQWARLRAQPLRGSVPTVSPSAATPVAAQSSPAPGRVRRALGYAVLLAALAAPLAFIYYRPLGHSADPGQQQGTKPPPSTTSTGEYGSRALQSEHAFYGYFPALRSNLELRPGVVWALLGVGALSLLGLALPMTTPWLSRPRRSGMSVALDDSSLRSEAGRIVPPLSPDVRARMERHVVGPASLRERLQRRAPLDVRRTVETSLRNLGVLRLRYRPARLRPSYLLLIDAAQAGDPRGRMFYHWAERLRTQQVDVSIRLVRFDAATQSAVTVCPNESGWQLDGQEGEPLDRLPTPPVGQRLIVVTDGDLLVESDAQPGGEDAMEWRDWALRARFYRWPQRAVFTPVEPREWGAREEAIERSERAADPGFVILPLDENALAAWAELIVTGRLPDFSLSRPQRYPRLLRELPDRVLFDADMPLPRERLSVLLAQLKLYLGENAYYWLCACAVPPFIRWELTLLLGEQYLLNAGAPPEQLPQFIAGDYPRLASLPWMRRAQMPTWLRLALLDSVPPALQEEIRQVVRSQLRVFRPDAQSGAQFRLQLEAPPQALGLHGAERERSEPLADTLYLGFVDGYSPRQLQLRAPREWSSWLKRFQTQRRRGKWRDWLGALRDRLFWRSGLSFLGHARRVMVWAAGLGLGAVVFLWLGMQAHDMPMGLKDALYRQRTYAVGFDAGTDEDGWLVGSLRFSADGKQVYAIASPEDHWDAASGKSLRGAGAPPLWDGKKPQTARRLKIEGDKIMILDPQAERNLRIDQLSPDPTDVQSILAEPIVIATGVGDATIGPDGRYLAVTDHKNRVGIWDAQLPRPEHELKLAITPGTKLIWRDKYLLIEPTPEVTAEPVRLYSTQKWSPQSGVLTDSLSAGDIAVLNDRQFTQRSLRSPDLHFKLKIVDNLVYIHRVADGKTVAPPLVHPGRVVAAAVSPDGRSIATAWTARPQRPAQSVEVPNTRAGASRQKRVLPEPRIRKILRQRDPAGTSSRNNTYRSDSPSQTVPSQEQKTYGPAMPDKASANETNRWFANWPDPIASAHAAAQAPPQAAPVQQRAPAPAAEPAQTQAQTQTQTQTQQTPRSGVWVWATPIADRAAGETFAPTSASVLRTAWLSVVAAMAVCAIGAWKSRRRLHTIVGGYAK